MTSTSTDPLVDVIIPTRNRLKLTIDAVRSVKAQTHSSWRLIIVDDASEAPVVSGLEDLAAEDRRISMIARSIPGGPQAARQTGWGASTADFVAFLDSDDVWMRTKLQRQLEVFTDRAVDLPNLGAVLCGHAWEDLSGARRGQPRRPKANGSASPLVSNNMSTILLRRDAVIRAGGLLPEGQRSLRTCEHVEFYMRLSQCCDFTVVDQALVVCRDHPGERASDALKTALAAEEMEYVLQLHQDMLESHPRERAQLQAQIGARYLEIHDMPRGIRYLRSSLKGAGFMSALKILRRFAPSAAQVVLKDKGRIKARA
jgi:glycosyltransferase involved in cell wall biosynthesis